MRIFLLKDEDMFRNFLRHIGEEVLGHVVVGESRNAEAALEMVVQLGPELMLLDIKLRDGDGLAAATVLRASSQGFN